jgi:hypothetical protein
MGLTSVALRDEDRSGSRQQRQTAGTKSQPGSARQNEARETDATQGSVPSASVMLDRLRDAAPAHDEDVPAPFVPEMPETR